MKLFTFFMILLMTFAPVSFAEDPDPVVDPMCSPMIILSATGGTMGVTVNASVVFECQDNVAPVMVICSFYCEGKIYQRSMENPPANWLFTCPYEYYDWKVRSLFICSVCGHRDEATVQSW